MLYKLTFTVLTLLTLSGDDNNSTTFGCLWWNMSKYI